MNASIFAIFIKHLKFFFPSYSKTTWYAMDGSEDNLIRLKDGKGDFDMKKLLPLSKWAKQAPKERDEFSDSDDDEDPFAELEVPPLKRLLNQYRYHHYFSLKCVWETKEAEKAETKAHSKANSEDSVQESPQTEAKGDDRVKEGKQIKASCIHSFKEESWWATTSPTRSSAKANEAQAIKLSLPSIVTKRFTSWVWR